MTLETSSGEDLDKKSGGMLIDIKNTERMPDTS